MLLPVFGGKPEELAKVELLPVKEDERDEGNGLDLGKPDPSNELRHCVFSY